MGLGPHNSRMRIGELSVKWDDVPVYIEPLFDVFSTGTLPDRCLSWKIGDGTGPGMPH